MPDVYLVIIFLVIVVLGIFWIMQNQNKGSHDFPPLFEKEIQPAEILLTNGIRKIEIFADRGKWLLFFTIVFILIEFFVFLSYSLNHGKTFNLVEVNHIYFLGGVLYFLLLLISLFLSLKISGGAREIPHFSESYTWTKSLWENRISEFSNDQKRQLTFFILDKLNVLEQAYSMALILVSSASTILIVWLANWLFSSL